MGLKDSLIGMMGDFVQMNRNPEFRSKTELSKAGTSDNLSVPNLQQRRHSLNITVGAQGPPDTFVRPRTYSIKSRKEDVNSSEKNSEDEQKKQSTKNRRFSAPCALKAPPPNFTFSLDESKKKTSLKKQKSLEKTEKSEFSDSSDSDNDYQKRRLAQLSPKFGSTGFFRPGSFREAAPIEEEPEDYPNSLGAGGITIVTTRF
ncbi:hypothetical protein FO519_003678 [Halicephalobus sp. NKZ332]|nr:hypothetical protein FO519_003678 [Halicephalobus sp. NKZ332]